MEKSPRSPSREQAAPTAPCLISPKEEESSESEPLMCHGTLGTCVCGRGGGQGTARMPPARRSSIDSVLTAFLLCEVCWTFTSTIAFHPYHTRKVLPSSHFMEEETEAQRSYSGKPQSWDVDSGLTSESEPLAMEPGSSQWRLETTCLGNSQDAGSKCGVWSPAGVC